MRVAAKRGCRESPQRTGLAAVELVVVLPLLVTVVLGCVDFGRFAYNYIAVTNAARAGAAYAIMNSYLVANQAAWKSQVQQAAKNEMAQQTGYVASNLTVQVSSFTDTNGLRRVQVTTGYPFRMIVSWPGIPNSVTLQASVEMRAIR